MYEKYQDQLRRAEFDAVILGATLADDSLGFLSVGAKSFAWDVVVGEDLRELFSGMEEIERDGADRSIVAPEHFFELIRLDGMLDRDQERVKNTQRSGAGLGIRVEKVLLVRECHEHL